MATGSVTSSDSDSSVIVSVNTDVAAMPLIVGTTVCVRMIIEPSSNDADKPVYLNVNSSGNKIVCAHGLPTSTTNPLK